MQAEQALVMRSISRDVAGSSVQPSEMDSLELGLREVVIDWSSHVRVSTKGTIHPQLVSTLSG